MANLTTTSLIDAFMATTTATGARSALGVPRVFNVMDAAYGAVGDGSTDDTVAINAAIAACISAKGGTVFAPRGRYKCAAALNGTTNGVITFPQSLVYYGQPIHVNFIGEAGGHITDASAADDGGTILDFSSAPVGSGTDPSAISGAASLTSALADFNRIGVHFDRMNIMLASDSTLSGINMRNCLRASFGNELGIFSINADGTISEPTHSNRGIIFPRFNNNVMNFFGATQIGGFAYGAEIGEHTLILGAYIASCGTAILLQEGNKRIWGAPIIEFCKHFIELPSSVAAPPKLDLSVDGESANTGDWRGYETALKDVNSVATGRIAYQITLAGTNTLVAPVVTGGLNVDVLDLNATVRDFSVPTAAVAQWNLHDLTDSIGTYTLTDHGTITFGAFKSGDGGVFNGTTQYGSNASLNLAGADFTIMGFVQFDTSGAQVLAAQWNTTVFRYQVALVTGKLHFYVYDAANNLVDVASQTLDLTVSHHWCVQYSHALKIARLKVDNGAWVTVTMAAVMNSTGTTPILTVGAALEGAANTASGLLDGKLGLVKTYRSIAPQKDITEHYAGGNGSDL